MAKKNQIERAIEALEAKKAAQIAAIDAAISELRAQHVKTAKRSRPRAVAAVAPGA